MTDEAAEKAGLQPVREIRESEGDAELAGAIFSIFGLDE